MTILLVIIALLVAFVGALFLTEATMGVGIICGACFLAILARITQASSQHEKLMKKIESENKAG